MLVVAMIIFGLNAGGDKPVVVDIAPDHSGTIYGITNAIASLPGILSPLVVGFMISTVSSNKIDFSQVCLQVVIFSLARSEVGMWSSGQRQESTSSDWFSSLSLEPLNHNLGALFRVAPDDQPM